MAKYTDFSLNFLSHPVTGDVSILTDEKSINQAIKNLVFTDKYEVPFNPSIGGNVRGTLFQMADSITEFEIKERLIDLFEGYEPRISINDISVLTISNENKLKISINYTIKTSSQEIIFDFYLDRIV